MHTSQTLTFAKLRVVQNLEHTYAYAMPVCLLILCLCQLNKAYSAKVCWDTALSFGHEK